VTQRKIGNNLQLQLQLLRRKGKLKPQPQVKAAMLSDRRLEIQTRKSSQFLQSLNPGQAFGLTLTAA
jgi:hypothetical protein